MLTLEQKLKSSDNRPSGFDYMRIILAISVVIMHSVITTKGQQADVELWTTPLRPLLRIILPMFFTLSGFLVAGSLERCSSLISFLGLRAIRIYPALMIEVLLSVFIIGLSVTDLSIRNYFLDTRFREYLLNMTGDIHYILPGVFKNTPYPNIVNAQLWTVPYELGCYMILSVLSILGLKKRPIIAPIATVALSMGYVVLRLIKHHGEYPFIVGGVPGIMLIVSFLTGLSLYLFRDIIPYSQRVFLTSVVGAVIFLSYVPIGEQLGIIMLGYATVWIGLTNHVRIKAIRGADYSYGVYLYGFSIQQLFSYLFPELRFWWMSILVCVPSALIFAAFSWNFVEKPALKFKRPLMKFEAKYLHIWGKLLSTVF